MRVRSMMHLSPSRRGSIPRTRRSSSRPPTVESLESRQLLSAGDLDTTFGPAGTGLVTADLPGSTSEYGWSVAVQADGKIVAAGQRQLFADPLGDFVVARYNTGGTLDT